MKLEEKIIYVTEIIKKSKIDFVIVGGFASILHGVKRKMTDIDIDLFCSKDDDKFKELYQNLSIFITSPLEYYQDINYKNWNFEINYKNQIFDFSTSDELEIFDKNINNWVNFYKDNKLEIDFINYKNIELPVLSKDLIIKNKETIPFQRDVDFLDINELKRLCRKK